MRVVDARWHTRRVYKIYYSLLEARRPEPGAQCNNNKSIFRENVMRQQMIREDEVLWDYDYCAKALYWWWPLSEIAEQNGGNIKWKHIIVKRENCQTKYERVCDIWCHPINWTFSSVLRVKWLAANYEKCTCTEHRYDRYIPSLNFYSEVFQFQKNFAGDFPPKPLGMGIRFAKLRFYWRQYRAITNYKIVLMFAQSFFIAHRLHGLISSWLRENCFIYIKTSLHLELLLFAFAAPKYWPIKERARKKIEN